MKKDIPENLVEGVSVAIVLENGEGEHPDWQAYFLNERDSPVQNVMVSSKGYGNLSGREVKTSVLRHFIGDVGAHDYARIEPVDQQVFGLTNEYWVSYYVNGTIHDKKFIFQPNSIEHKNLTEISLLGKPGILENKNF